MNQVITICVPSIYFRFDTLEVSHHCHFVTIHVGNDHHSTSSYLLVLYVLMCCTFERERERERANRGQQWFESQPNMPITPPFGWCSLPQGTPIFLPLHIAKLW